MTDSPSLGDILRDSMEAATARQEFLARPTTMREAERTIAALAGRFGVEPGAAIDELRGNSALALLARGLLGVDADRASSFWTAVDTIAAVRREGMLKGEAVYKEAAKRLSTRDAAGRVPRQVTPDSLRTYEKEGRRLMRRLMIADLFTGQGRPRRGKSSRS